MTPEELLKLWKLEQVTVEMAMGHVLQNLVRMHALDKTNSPKLYQLRRDVDELLAHSGIKPRSKDKRKS
jgi:hypothetical protein